MGVQRRLLFVFLNSPPPPLSLVSLSACACAAQPVGTHHYGRPHLPDVRPPAGPGGAPHRRRHRAPAERSHRFRCCGRWVVLLARPAAPARPTPPPPVPHRQAGAELEPDGHRPVWAGAAGVCVVVAGEKRRGMRASSLSLCNPTLISFPVLLSSRAAPPRWPCPTSPSRTSRPWTGPPSRPPASRAPSSTRTTP